jgi:hypothetical protein
MTARSVGDSLPVREALTNNRGRAFSRLAQFVVVGELTLKAFALGNVCTRILAPVGPVELRTNFSIRDSGQPDEIVPSARQHPIDELPEDVLVSLLGSRYCETQKLSDFAWQNFGFGRSGQALSSSEFLAVFLYWHYSVICSPNSPPLITLNILGSFCLIYKLYLY